VICDVVSPPVCLTMRPRKDHFDGNEQDHPIDEDIVSEIAGANSVSSRTLDSALWRFNRSLDTNSEIIAGLVSDSDAVGSEIQVEHINDDVMIIDAPWVIVAQWLLWTGQRLRVARCTQGKRSIPAMVREAHAKQATRLSNSSRDSDVGWSSALVLSQSAYSDCE
jgi:hypothetical protein